MKQILNLNEINKDEWYLFLNEKGQYAFLQGWFLLGESAVNSLRNESSEEPYKVFKLDYPEERTEIIAKLKLIHKLKD